MKKPNNKIVAVICILTAVCIALMLIILNNTHYEKINDIECYKEESFIDLNGGTEAAEFFTNCSTYGTYDITGFIYKDYEKIISLHKYYTVFMLEQKYTDESYYTVIENLLSHTDNPDPHTNMFGDFTVATITDDENLYKENLAVICYNNDSKIIRFIFFYKFNDTKNEYVDIRKIIPWHLSSVNW